MKKGNYQGYMDRGYIRYADVKNSDRLINGLVLRGATRHEDSGGDIPIPPPLDTNNYIVHGNLNITYAGKLITHNR